MPQTDYECQSCGHATSGYTKNELTDTGWVWWSYDKAKAFIMCGLCVKVYEKRWNAKKAA